MSINIIAAVSKNKVIGLNGAIPWKISKDLKYFQRLTTHKTKYDPPGINVCLMGRKTWDSLPTYPEPLPDRASIVVTKNNSHKIITYEQAISKVKRNLSYKLLRIFTEKSLKIIRYGRK